MRRISRKMHRKVIEINHGIGHTINGVIYINKYLKENMRLYVKVLRHEMQHINGELHVDKNEKFDLELLKWIILNPRSWTHFSPIWYCDQQIAISRRYTIIWSFILIWSYIMFQVFKWINTQ